MIIRLTEEDIKKIVRETAMLVLERKTDYYEENICYFPYRVTMAVSDHSIEREYQRAISDADVAENVRSAVKSIIEDVAVGNVAIGERVKIINKETCVVTIIGVVGNEKARKITKLVVVTCYIWDGRVNIDLGKRYYVGEESPEYIEAKEWNAENQDKVEGYMEWKRYGTGMDKRMKKAEKEYGYRQHPQMKSHENMMKRLNHAYDLLDKDQKDAIHKAMDPRDLKAVRDYYKNVDRKQLSTKGSPNRMLRAMDLIRKRKELNDEND